MWLLWGRGLFSVSTTMPRYLMVSVLGHLFDYVNLNLMCDLLDTWDWCTSYVWLDYFTFRLTFFIHLIVELCLLDFEYWALWAVYCRTTRLVIFVQVLVWGGPVGESRVFIFVTTLEYPLEVTGVVDLKEFLDKP